MSDFPLPNFPLFQPRLLPRSFLPGSSCCSGSTSYSYIITVYLGRIVGKTGAVSKPIFYKINLCSEQQEQSRKKKGLLNVSLLSLNKRLYEYVDFFFFNKTIIHLQFRELMDWDAVNWNVGYVWVKIAVYSPRIALIGLLGCLNVTKMLCVINLLLQADNEVWEKWTE